MRNFLYALIAGLISFAASADYFEGYVCKLAISPAHGSYWGQDGNAVIILTSLPNCQGTKFRESALPIAATSGAAGCSGYVLTKDELHLLISSFQSAMNAEKQVYLELWDRCVTAYGMIDHQQVTATPAPTPTPTPPGRTPVVIRPGTLVQ